MVLSRVKQIEIRKSHLSLKICFMDNDRFLVRIFQLYFEYEYYRGVLGALVKILW